MVVSATLEKIPVVKPPLPESEFVRNCIALGVKKPNSAVAHLAASADFFKLVCVDLSPNFLGGLGLQALSPLLYENTVLQSINLANNGLSNESIVFFCRQFVAHPSLKSINLNNNNALTLPAGEALLHFVQRNPLIEELSITGTSIDDAVVRSIRRHLNLRREALKNGSSQGGKKVASTAPNASSSPYERVLNEYQDKRESKKAALKEEHDKTESDALDNLRVACGSTSVGKPLLPPSDSASGWTVINVAVVAFPSAFNSEQNVILNEIIPELNDAYSSKKIYFQVLENGSREEAGKSVDVPNAVVAEDFLADLRKNGGIVIELVGDRLGFVAMRPVVSTGADAASGPLEPLQHRLHDFAAQQMRSVLISCLRKTTRQLSLPPSMTPLFSDEPSLVHPDPQASLVKAAVAKARKVEHKLFGFDIEVAQRSWDQHVSFMSRVKSEALVTSGSSLAGGDGEKSSRIVKPRTVIDRYGATYDTCDGKGRVFLRDLDDFKVKLKKRLLIAAESILEGPQAVADSSESNRNAFIQHRASEYLTIRKQLLGKLDLYTVTPPSRNMLLLHGAPGASLSTVFCGYIHRSQKKPNYVTAYHFTRQSRFCDEPSDLRSLFMSLIRQLSSDRMLPKHVESEIDITRLQQIFLETLTKASSTLEDGKVIVLAIDGLSDLDDVVFPCENLRKSDTGVEIWAPSLKLVDKPAAAANGTEAAESVDSTAVVHPKLSSNEPADKLSFIPVCLPRNVRLVGTVTSGSKAHMALEQRGRDSTDCIPLGDLSPNEMDLILQSEVKRLGITLSDDDLAAVRCKTSATSLEYLAFVLDALRGLTEAPDYLSVSGLLASYPPTLQLACEHILSRLEIQFGFSLTRAALGALVYSRWGISEMDLREFLSQLPECKKYTRLPSSELNKFLRILRPALEWKGAGCVGGAGPFNCSSSCGASNALHDIALVRSRTMRSCIETKYFALPETVSIVHQQLAHHYRRMIRAFPDHPLSRTALKELPYHATIAKMWNLLAEMVFSLDYVTKCFHYHLGYQLFRECIRAYNILDEEIRNSNTPPTKQMVVDHSALLDKMKQYIFFIRDHNVNLVQFPHLVAQIAIGYSSTSHVHADALVYFKANPNLPHIVVASRSSGKLHRERVNDVQFAPNGIRFATCSDDRSIRLVNGYGESILHICQSAAKLKFIRYSPTSRYLLAVTEDRNTFVFDATSGQLVSKAYGHAAPIQSAEMSARGKFYATGSNDRTLKIWESETGAVLATASHQSMTVSSSSTGGVSIVVPHPLSEETFFTVCDKKVIGWKLNHMRDACDQILCLQGHHTLPLSSLALAMDGSYIIACAREPDQSGTSSSRTEENVKVWNSSGRHVASLLRSTPDSNATTIPGPIFFVLSPNEKRLACALSDGSILVYEMDWRSYSVGKSSDDNDPSLRPYEVTPSLYLKGYQGHADPVVTILRFSHDSALLFAIGNLRQLKVWSVVASTPKSVEGGSPTRAGRAMATVNGVMAVDTYAEYLSDQMITALAATPNPHGDDCGGIAIGEATGRVLALKLVAATVSST